MITKADPLAAMRQSVADYISGVLSGDIVTGRLVRLAVERHVRDLKDGPARGLWFNEGAALRACMAPMRPAPKMASRMVMSAPP